MYINVLLESPFLFNDTLTYLSRVPLSVGVRVRVPLQNREVIGFVLEVDVEVDTDIKILEVIDVIDDKPILNEELIQLGIYMSDHTITPLIRCFQTMLPNALKPSSSFKQNKKLRVLYPTGKYPQDLTKRQLEVVDEFVMPTPYSIINKAYSNVRVLIEKGYFVEEYVDDVPEMYSFKGDSKTKELTVDQSKAIKSIQLNKAQTYLIHGITGSGKTEIYLQLAQEVLTTKKSVIILVPEISLTTQMISQFKKRLGDKILVYHSGLSNTEKYKQYLLAQSMEYGVVVGTRSSIFMPFESIGLIVMDEEHDSSYKQSNAPYYHTRDLAIFRSEYHQAPLVLGSATPALETYARALRGNYTLLELPQRINKSMPNIKIVDTQKLMYQGNLGILSPYLLEQIETTLNKQEQVMVLLNRRGYYPIIKDANSLEVKMCPNCDVCLTYHKNNHSLLCHQCGYQENINPKDITVGYGIGTQRLEELLAQRFKSARIQRMDADSTTKKDSHQTIIHSFEKGDIDILIGTQMIAKGLDIENVTLMGIINGDNALSYPDYRSVEVTFDTLTQAIGRSGRGQKKGEVVVQTFNPDHYAVRYALENKYKHFFQEEMKYRKLAAYPPYNYLISVIIMDENEETAQNKAQTFLKSYNKREETILGPTRIRKLSSRYRIRILFKGKDIEGMKVRIRQAYELYYKQFRGGIIVDVNPLNIE